MSPLSLLFDYVAEKAAAELSSHVKASLAPLAPYLRKLTVGATLVLVSVSGWCLALVFLLISFFFALVPLYQYVVPALWVSLLGGLLGAICLFSGLSLVRKPR